jgi:hypothetical protein
MDLTTGRLLKKLQTQCFDIRSVAISNNNIIALNENSNIQIFGLRSGKCLRSIENNDDNKKIYSIAISNDIIVSGGETKNINIYAYDNML